MNKRIGLRAIAMMLLLVLALAPLAAQNYQKVFSIDAEEYEALCYLYIDQGLSYPSSSGPWSAAELSMMLSKIRRSDLSDAMRSVYDFVDESIEDVENHRVSDTLAMSYDNTVSLEGYFHTNTDNYNSEELWRYDFEERRSMYNGDFETWAGDMFYGDFDIDLKLNQFGDTNDSSALFGDSAITTNLLMVPPSTLNDLNMNIPYQAYGSIGGEHWNLQAGRDNLQWGSGVTGNLMLGGHLDYQDMVKFTTFHDNYKFTQVYSFFTHPMNYLPNTVEAGGAAVDALSPSGQGDVMDGIRMFIAHRLEFRMFEDLLNFTLSESMMYMSEENTWNLGLLNPFMIYHDNYIRANSNSLLSLEIETTPINNWSAYGQLVLDEFPLPGEPSSGSGTNPTALGYLAGIKTAYPVGAGVLYGMLEGAHTDPYLYLRGDGLSVDDQDYGDIGINYVVGLRSFTPSGNISIAEDFIGYEYGCDAIVLNLTGGYKVFNKFYVEGTLFYMLHGINDLHTLWDEGADGADDPSQYITPNTNSTGNILTSGEAKDSIETTLLLEVKGGYHILPNLEVYGQVDFVNKTNFNNVAANGTQADTQVSIGTSLSF